MNLPGRKPLGPLEHGVMQLIWDRQQATADEVRKALPEKQDFKESTIRTILRRLEEKHYLEHVVEGRTYVYQPRVKPENVASRQVLGIIDKFCRGSVENLLLGMVDDEVITAEKLRELADRISAAESQPTSTRQKTTRKRKR
ncbi:MAG: BlaI/MecI/CopY family transcriptional regulator [Planctomycetota bacterium]